MATRMTETATLRSQRRFLILMSIAVAAYYYLQVHTEGSGEYSGLHIKLGRPDRVPYAVWILFGWALLRYAQLFHEQWRRVRSDLLREFEYYDHQLALAAATRYARENRLALVKGITDPVVIGEAWYVPSMRDRLIDEVQKQARDRGQEPSEPEPKDEWWVLTPKGERYYRGFGIEVRERGKPESGVGVEFNMPAWGRMRVKYHQARVWWRTAVRMPAVGEYLAPFAIAALAVVVAVVYRLPSTQCV